MSFKKKLTSIKNNGFIRSASVLVGGTASAQIMMMLALPLLTRLYSPDDFSILAVYTAIISIISVGACLRLDIAIPLPESDEEAINLLAVALICAAALSGVTAAFILTFPTAISQALNQPNIEPYLWLVPIGIFITSSYNALQFWATRKKAFHIVAKTRISQALGSICTQLSLGWIGITPLGLILGQIANSGTGLISLIRLVVQDGKNILNKITYKTLVAHFIKYNHYPKYSTPEALMNSAGIQVPIILIASAAVGQEAGFLMLAMRVMQAPMGLIGGAIGQVYLSRASEELRNGTLSKFTIGTISGLLKLGAGPLLFAGLVAPNAFSLAFGDEWRRAGELVSWMTPWLFMQLLASPISMVMHVCHKQRTMLFLTIGGIILRIGTVLVVLQLFPEYTSEGYAVSSALFYIICFATFSNTAGLNHRDHLRILKSGLAFLMIWALAGYLLNITLTSLR